MRLIIRQRLSDDDGFIFTAIISVVAQPEPEGRLLRVANAVMREQRSTYLNADDD